MTKLPNSRGLIFDLDGTLLDTEPLYSEAAQKVLDPFGHTYTLELKKKVMGGDSHRSAQLNRRAQAGGPLLGVQAALIRYSAIRIQQQAIEGARDVAQGRPCGVLWTRGSEGET